MRRAFTLIELLVVVAIIALLIAMLLPAMAKAKEETKITKCQANLHAIGIALATYNGQNKDLQPCVDPCYLPEWNNSQQLMSWNDQMYVDGCFKQDTNWKGMGGAMGTGTAANNGYSWHYPTSGYGIFQCPKHAKEFQNVQGTLSDGRTAQGYSLAWCARSGFYAYPSNGGPWNFQARNLNAQHIMVMEAGTSAGSAGAYPVPAHMDRTTTPGYAGYGMYERHYRNNVRGANFLFADNHAEYSAEYGWAPSAYAPTWSMNWATYSYKGPPVLPNGKPNTMMKNRIWVHGGPDS